MQEYVRLPDEEDALRAPQVPLERVRRDRYGLVEVLMPRKEDLREPFRERLRPPGASYVAVVRDEDPLVALNPGRVESRGSHPPDGDDQHDRQSKRSQSG